MWLILLFFSRKLTLNKFRPNSKAMCSVESRKKHVTRQIGKVNHNALQCTNLVGLDIKIWFYCTSHSTTLTSHHKRWHRTHHFFRFVINYNFKTETWLLHWLTISYKTRTLSAKSACILSAQIGSMQMTTSANQYRRRAYFCLKTQRHCIN